MSDLLKNENFYSGKFSKKIWIIALWQEKKEEISLTTPLLLKKNEKDDNEISFFYLENIFHDYGN